MTLPAEKETPEAPTQVVETAPDQMELPLESQKVRPPKKAKKVVKFRVAKAAKDAILGTK